MTLKESRVPAARRELRLRMGHALGHSYEGPGRPLTHNSLNIDGFMRELENFIDAKIEAALK